MASSEATGTNAAVLPAENCVGRWFSGNWYGTSQEYIASVQDILANEDWLDPAWFRFGASTLLNDLLMQRTRMVTGRYSGPDYFTLD